MRDVSRFVFILLLVLCLALGVWFVNSYLDRNRKQAEINSPDAVAASTKAKAENIAKAAHKKRDTQFAQRQTGSDAEIPFVDAPAASAGAGDPALRKVEWNPPTEVPVGTSKADLNSQFGPPDVTLLWSDRGILTVKYVYVRSMRMTTFLLQGEKVIFSSTDPTAPPRASSLSPMR